MWPFTPDWKSTDLKKRFKGFNKLNPRNPKHQTIIEEFGLKDSDYHIRLLAYKLLGKDNADVLAEISGDLTDRCYHEKAVAKLTNQIVLTEIAYHAKNIPDRSTAIGKLTNQDIVIDIARNTRDKKLLIAAFRNISDQQSWVDIARSSKNEELDNEALKKIEKLTDKDALTDLAKNAKSRKISQAAMDKVTDQDAIFDLAKNASDQDIRSAAFKKIIDQSAWIEIIKNTNLNDDAAIEKVNQLKDYDILTDFAINGSKNFIRRAAINNLLNFESKSLNISKHIDNLINLLFMKNITNAPEIALALKALYNNQKLTEGNKAKILSCQGKSFNIHTDMEYNNANPGCNIYVPAHNDYFSTTSFII